MWSSLCWIFLRDFISPTNARSVLCVKNGDTAISESSSLIKKNDVLGGSVVFFTLCCSLIVGEEISFSSAGRKVFLLRYNRIQELIERTEFSNPGVASRRKVYGPWITTSWIKELHTLTHFFHILNIRVSHGHQWNEIQGGTSKYSYTLWTPAERNPERGQDLWTHVYAAYAELLKKNNINIK